MIANGERCRAFLAKRETGLGFEVQRRLHQHAAVLTELTPAMLSGNQALRSFWISIFIANWPSLSYCELTVVSVIRKSRFAWCLGMPQIPLPPLTEISVLTGKS